MKKKQKYHNLIRDTSGPNYGEIFLVSSVATIVITRAFLHVTGYPQIGNSTFHIAHMLWGGLLMLVSIIILLNYINIQLKWFASFLAGIGFGLFIDELGKFITSNNDYFFKPTFAIMYGIFLIIFFALQYIQEHTHYTKEELEINKTVRELSDKDENALFPALYRQYSKIIKQKINKVVESKMFRYVLVGYFFVSAFIEAFGLIASFFVKVDRSFVMLSNIRTIEVISTVIYNVLVIIGVYLYIRKNRYKAYFYFRYATYVSIFVLQFYMFLDNQLLGIIGFFASLLALGSINYMIAKHKEKLAKK